MTNGQFVVVTLTPLLLLAYLIAYFTLEYALDRVERMLQRYCNKTVDHLRGIEEQVQKSTHA